MCEWKRRKGEGRLCESKGWGRGRSEWVRNGSEKGKVVPRSQAEIEEEE
jgi:hypothetical protein